MSAISAKNLEIFEVSGSRGAPRRRPPAGSASGLTIRKNPINLRGQSLRGLPARDPEQRRGE